MLRLENITKVYETKEMRVDALRGVSLAFRENEFVAILGPSGCGKTTLLNLIGGLDHYSSGNLTIGGVSTKRYSDRDWDVYRNHRIGFIFQSYNLIPHENILENVELALTIAGLKKEERVRLAREALDKVGLAGMYAKRPNELSGGQCQRVAIARALVNQPDILLADEPTGALDSATSLQIMDLIHEIAKRKLVIMVTHNPQLAARYATRTVRLLDGLVVDDSNPYPFDEEEREAVSATGGGEARNEKAKMSWWTACKLSARNLWSKARRTAMIVAASSIGIVGVSAVLAVSQGVSGYIAGMQDDMLSGYPIQAAESSLDLAGVVSGVSSAQQNNAVFDSWRDGQIDVQFMVERLMQMSENMENAFVSNEITEDYVQFVDDMPASYYAALGKEFGIDVKNNLFTHTDIRLGGYSSEELARQRYSLSGITSVCMTILENVNGGKYASYASLVDEYTDAVGQCLEEEEYVLSQYDVVSGHYAAAENELMIVLNHRNELTDFVLTLLGYYGQDAFANGLYRFAGETAKMDQALWQTQQSISIEDLLGKEYIYYPNDSLYRPNPSYNPSAFQLRQYDYAFLDDRDAPLAGGQTMRVVGILCPKENVRYGCLTSGLYFTPAFARRFVADNLHSTIAEFVKSYVAGSPGASGFSSSLLKMGNNRLISGIGYRYQVKFPDGIGSSDVATYEGYGLVGSQSAWKGLMGMLSGSSSGSGEGSGLVVERMAALSVRNVGGKDTPGTLKIYPHTFKDKYLVTDYLNRWNGDETIALSTGKSLTPAERSEIKYTDNLEIIISLVNNVINVVTIALVCFTALSLVVSTVMIGVITYVSVMERVKEIGVIRSLGGRKKDVSHLFNAETLILGGAAGLFGLFVTYAIELVLNIVLSAALGLTMVADLAWWTALIVLGISVLLTMVAGILPAQAAARQDPVVALRAE